MRKIHAERTIGRFSRVLGQPPHAGATAQRTCPPTGYISNANWRTTLALVLVLLCSCVTIQQPPNNASGVANPVAVSVTWNEDMQVGTFFATLDGSDVTQQFQVDYTARQATATLALVPSSSSRILTAGGSVYSPLAFGYGPASSTNTFSIAQPTATLVEAQPNIGRGGRAIAVSVSSANNQTAIAASESGGLFQTTDGGKTWPHVDTFLPIRMSDVAYVPTGVANPGTIVATVTADGRTDPLLNRGGVWVSNADGVGWTHVVPPAPCASAPLSGFGIAYSGTDTVFVATSCGLLVNRSLGTGPTWMQTTNWQLIFPQSVISVVAQAGAPPNQIIDVCLTGGGNDRSVNGGTTWGPPVFANPGPDCQSPHSIASSPLNSNVLLATFGLPNAVTSVVESDTGGQTWTNLQAGSNNQGGRNTFVTTHAAADQDPTHFDLYFAGRFITCKTPSVPGALSCPNDVGNGWPFIPSVPALAHDIVGVAFPASGNCPMYMAADYGIYEPPAASTKPPCGDPAQWIRVGFGSLQIYQVAGQIQPTVSGGGVNLPGHTSLVFGSMDNGLWGTFNVDATPWSCFGAAGSCDPEGSFLQVAPAVGPSNSAQITLNSLDTSVMEQVTVNELTGAISDESNWNAVTPPGNASPPFAIAPSVYVQWSGGTLFLTPDNAATWPPVGTLPTTVPGPNGTTVPVALVPANAIQISASPLGPVVIEMVTDTNTNNQGLVRLGKVFPPPATPGVFEVETLGGVTRAGPHLGSPSNLTGIWGNCFGQAIYCAPVYAADPNNFRHLYAVDSLQRVVVSSADGGATWSEDVTLTQLVTAGGVPMIDSAGSSQVHAIAYDPSNSSHLVVGTDEAGIFVSGNGGQSWAALAGTSRATNISSFYFDDRANVIYVGTYGRGLWKLTLDWTTVH